MRRWQKAIVLPAAVVAVLAGVVIAQEGPRKDPGETVARPKRPASGNDTNANDSNLPPIPSKLSKKAQPDLPKDLATFKSDVDVVNVDVAVIDNKGHFIPNVPKDAFRVLEDNVPQQLKEVNAGEAPVTICLVIEFSALFQRYWTEGWAQTLTAAYGFLETLKQEDYVAVVAYDLKSEILTDFTADKSKVADAMRRLNFPGFSEADMFDAVTDTADRMQEIEGRKAILLISSGIDTFSKLTLDKTRKKLQEAGVPIYAIGLMQALRERVDAYGGMAATTRMDFLQADNQLRTFAKETGGMAFFPRFYGEFPNIFQQVAQALRNQYNITYTPANRVRDGKFRKIKVELVNPGTSEPLRVVDEKGKPVKYSIVAKAGYTAPNEVE